jgi:hypothetical protein
VGAQRLAQRRHELPLDDVEEHAADGVLAVEQLGEPVAGQDEQERPLPADGGNGRWAAVDEALVAERLARPGAQGRTG